MMDKAIMVIDETNFDELKRGMIISLERGVPDEVGYRKFVRVVDSPGNPDYMKFSIVPTDVKKWMDAGYTVTLISYYVFV